MNKIVFNFIDIQNFRNIPKLHFNLDQPGINIIRGINGAGKTSLFEALVWGLYNVNLKNTSNDDVVTWSENRNLGEEFIGTRVLISFNIGKDNYIVARHKDYKLETLGYEGKNKLLIFVNNTLYSGLHKKDNQLIINELLGMDSKMFINSILFGQRMPRFLDVSNADKRELFEKFVDLSFIKEAKDYATQVINVLKDKINEKNNVINRLNYEVSYLEKEIADVDVYNQNLINQRNNVINNLKKEIQEFDNLIKLEQQKLNDLSKKVENLENNTFDVDELRKKHSELLKSKEDLNNTLNEKDKILMLIKNSTKNINEWQSLIEDYTIQIKELKNKYIEKTKDAIYCYACGQKLPENKIESIKKSMYDDNFKPQIDKYTSLINDFKSKIESANLQIEKYNQKLESIDEDNILNLMTQIDSEIERLNELLTNANYYYSVIANIEKSKDLIKNYTSNKQNRLTQIDSINSKPLNLKNKEELIQKLTVAKTELNATLKEVELMNRKYEKIQWWITNGFSSKGLPSYMFTSIIDNINKIIEKYAKSLGISVKFAIDYSQVSKPIVTKCSIGNKQNKLYEELSGGEKRRIDIILIFAFYEIVSYTKDINILIMDEVFEGLDEEGESVVFYLIRMMAEEGKSIYVITHSNKIDGVYCRTIKLHKNEIGNLNTVEYVG